MCRRQKPRCGNAVEGGRTRRAPEKPVWCGGWCCPPLSSVVRIILVCPSDSPASSRASTPASISIACAPSAPESVSIAAAPPPARSRPGWLSALRLKRLRRQVHHPSWGRTPGGCGRSSLERVESLLVLRDRHRLGLQLGRPGALCRANVSDR